MAKIFDLRKIAEDESNRQKKIENNQRMLEEMASGPSLNAEEARRRSEASRLAMDLANTKAPATEYGNQIIQMPPEEVIQYLSTSTRSLIGCMRFVDNPMMTMQPFDRSNRVKACDESIIPFESPVIRFSDEIVTSYAGPIGLLSKPGKFDDPRAFLYYRKQYLFLTLWDFCLFMAGTKKYHSFYGPMLDCTEESTKHILTTKLLSELRKNESFAFDAMKRSFFVQEILLKSSRLIDHVCFHLQAQLGIARSIENEFSVL